MNGLGWRGLQEEGSCLRVVLCQKIILDHSSPPELLRGSAAPKGFGVCKALSILHPPLTLRSWQGAGWSYKKCILGFIFSPFQELPS